MLCLALLSFFLPLILGQHDGYSKHRESRIFHQQHNEIPKQTNLKFTSIGSYSGSSEDSQFASEEFSRNFISQNEHGQNGHSNARTFENRNVNFQEGNGLVDRINNHPGRKNLDDIPKNRKFNVNNGVDIRQKNHPGSTNSYHPESINSNQLVPTTSNHQGFRNGNHLGTRTNDNYYNNNNKELNNFEEREKYEKFQSENDILGTGERINSLPRPRNFDERQNNSPFQKTKSLGDRKNNNPVSGGRNFDGNQRPDIFQNSNWERFQRKDRLHSTNEFEGRQKTTRYEEGARVDRPQQRRPRTMGRGRGQHAGDGRRSPKVVKYIADQNGFAVREDLVKPLQDTIDRTRQESRRRVVTAVAGSSPQGSRMSQVVTSAIRVAGQSGGGKFLPHIFDLKKRPKGLDVDRLAYSVGAREVVI